MNDDSRLSPTIFVFGGLPGVGKTTLSLALARGLQAAYIRIDTIEQTLLRSGALPVGDEGYLVGYAIAEDNLRAGKIVIADAVNPIPLTRNAWVDISLKHAASVVQIEIICSDKNEHRQRIETRKADIKDYILPTWENVLDQEYASWDSKDITIDTAGKSPSESLNELLEHLQKR